jgi:hypothetical protein
MIRPLTLSASLSLFSLTQSAWAAPTIDPADDAAQFGPPEKILFWTPEQQVAGYRNMEQLAPVRLVSASEHRDVAERQQPTP